MNFEATLAEWAAHCRQLARSAREDAHRAEAYATLDDPDATVRLLRREVGSLESQELTSRGLLVRWPIVRRRLE